MKNAISISWHEVFAALASTSQLQFLLFKMVPALKNALLLFLFGFSVNRGFQFRFSVRIGFSKFLEFRFRFGSVLDFSVRFFGFSVNRTTTTSKELQCINQAQNLLARKSFKLVLT